MNKSPYNGYTNYETWTLPELTGFAADLLNAAMSEVNWREIAQDLVNEAKEEANA